MLVSSRAACLRAHAGFELAKYGIPVAASFGAIRSGHGTGTRRSPVAVETANSLNGPSDPAIGTAQNNLTSVYLALGRNVDADTVARRALTGSRQSSL